MALIREIGKNGRGSQCMVEVSRKKESARLHDIFKLTDHLA